MCVGWPSVCGGDDVVSCVVKVVIDVVVVNLDIMCCCCVGIIHGDHLVPRKLMCCVVEVVAV